MIYEYLITNPEAAYAVRVNSNDMAYAGIVLGDIAIIERCSHVCDGILVIGFSDTKYVIRYVDKNFRTNNYKIMAVVKGIIRKYI